MMRYRLMKREMLSYVGGIRDSWGPWDVFISGYDESERVRVVYDSVKSNNKHWIIHDEHDAVPRGSEEKFFCGRSEGESIVEFLNERSPHGGWTENSVCIDISGLLVPHLIVLVKAFQRLGIEQIDVVYSEPSMYLAAENTEFSVGPVEEVRQIEGYEGVSDTDTTNDVCILSVGFDENMITEIAEDKDKADKIRIFGFPSHQADMYQQNALKAYHAARAVGESWDDDNQYYFAPANDPFVVADTLSGIVSERRRLKTVSNVYLAPLASKPHALGFALYYLAECEGKCVSMLYPFCGEHAKKTNVGISRIWKYTIEFPLLE